MTSVQDSPRCQRGCRTSCENSWARWQFARPLSSAVDERRPAPECGGVGQGRREPPVMNAAFRQVIAAKDDERLELFLATARRLGTAVQNVEKDFWVCWVLDVLFNGMGKDGRACCSRAARRFRNRSV